MAIKLSTKKTHNYCVYLLNEAGEKNSIRNKLLKIADSLERDWNTVQQYNENTLASYSDNEKRINRAEQKKIKQINKKGIDEAGFLLRTENHARIRIQRKKEEIVWKISIEKSNWIRILVKRKRDSKDNFILNIEKSIWILVRLFTLLILDLDTRFRTLKIPPNCITKTETGVANALLYVKNRKSN